MTACPTTNPHPERGPLWVQYNRYPDTIHPHALMDGDTLLDQVGAEAEGFATQLGQDLPEGFTLGVVATGAALVAVDPDGTEWERHAWGVWFGDNAEVNPSATYYVRRVAKPSKVKVKVGDAYGRTIDGKRITGVGVTDIMPNGYYWLDGSAGVGIADADGMVEVDPLDGDR